jgi:peptidase M1-like protein
MRVLLLRACLIATLVSAFAPRPVAAQPDDLSRLVLAIEAAIRAGDHAALRALARSDINAGRLSDFAVSLADTASPEATVKERDRTPLVNGGQRLLLEVLTIGAGEGRVSTWRVDAVPGAAGAAWTIADVERITQINGLYRLALDTTVEWDVHDAVITAPDLTLTLASGYAFAARIPEGTTAMVFVGRGTVAFTPAPEAERNQVRIFSGSESLRTAFGALFIRLAPGEFAARVREQALKPQAADPAHLRRAQQVFDAQLPNSFQIDLNDLSTAQWSLIPASGDFVAEIATRKYGALTYARSGSEPEDISFFDRRRRRNIAVYASPERLATRGRFFSEDDQVDYDVTNYRIEASFSPERLWLDGTATLSIHAREALAGTMMLHLAEPLVVRSITSPQLGRLLHLRIVGQNNVLVGLPGVVPPDAEFDVAITYGGRLPPQTIEREALAVRQDPQERIPEIVIPPEPQWAYSNRSYWYPQGPVTDYATATIAITVPGDYDVVASGTAQGAPSLLADAAGQKPRKRYVFDCRQPARYLAFAVSRFQSLPSQVVKLRDDEEPLTLTLTANPRQAARLRQAGEKSADILRFYASLLGDAPYESLTVALTEGELPGGHSPAYLALLTQPLPTSPYSWSSDPVSFQGYPSFFLAHEIAHQWWGQAIGTKNYHEQWLSEGFAQYFAAMYAEKERGPEAFAGVVKQMRRWAMAMSPQGPVYLGYRLGHIRGDSRVFRALVYNKGAMALHMLRRLVGDEIFFAGLRDFYQTWRFKKAGTDDFRVAMEKAAGGRSLERFFDRWIYSAQIPSMRFTHVADGHTLRVRFDQIGDVYDIPITVTLLYADGTNEDVLVRVTEKTVEQRIPLKRALRSVDVNRDGGALVEIEK